MKQYRWKVVIAVAVVAVTAVAVLPLAAAETPPIIDNGGFERGLTSPWGTGHTIGQPGIWARSGDCRGGAWADDQVFHSGARSLYVGSGSPREPQVYGTTQQPFT